MIHYIHIDDKGVVVQRGYCASADEIPERPGCTHEVIDENDERRPNASADQTYRDRRRLEYPSIGDQLDAIWKTFDSLDLESDLLGSEASSMLNKIRDVKLKYPKA